MLLLFRFDLAGMAISYRVLIAVKVDPNNDGALR